LAEQYSSLCVASLNNSRSQWQENRGVDGLLNNHDIANSKEKEAERETETPPPNDPSAGTNPSTNNQSQTPPSSPTIQTIQFTISKADQVFPDYFLFFLETNPFMVNGSTITKITVDGSRVDNFFQRGDLQAGNTITITDVQFEPGRASIINDNELYISGFFDDIRVVSRATGSTPSVPPPNTPQLFPEVQQKNQF
jgi:hypothetical protein